MSLSTNVRRKQSLPILEVIGLILILLAIVLLVTQLGAFSENREEMPTGLVIGEVPVGGLSKPEAKAYLEQIYGAPVIITFQEQEIMLSPEQVGFQIQSDAMLSRADELRTEGTFWAGFWDFLWRRPERAYSVDLIADYSDQQLKAWISDVANRYDRPPVEASARLDSMEFTSGEPGYSIDQVAATEAISDALMRPTNRQVTLSVLQEEAPRPSLDTLEDLLVEYLVNEKFRGVASIQVIDEETGERISVNVDMRSGSPEDVDCEVAYAGLSTMKIPLTMEYFRWLIDIYPYEYDVIEATLTESSNLNANFMLRDIGGQNISNGTQVFNRSMKYLGLENTFMVSGYDEEDPPEYYSTPAREAARAGTCINTAPDPYMQTTATDVTNMMDMIYQCARYGGGDLLAAYPEQITQEECELMIDIMQENDKGQLIRAGLPPDVPVAHKHGFTFDTISDAAFVLSPGGDYTLVIFIWQDIDWVATIAHPLMEGISAATFNYFNPDMIGTPRRGLGDVLNEVDLPDSEDE